MKSVLNMSMAELRDRYRPKSQPWRSRWDALHKRHVKLLMQNTPTSLYEAAKLADEKYKVFCDYIKSLCQ